MDPEKPEATAPAAAADTPVEAAAETTGVRRRRPGKLALAAGGGVVGVAVLSGVLVWLWPSGPDPALAKKAIQERRAAVQPAAASAAQAASAEAADAAAQAASAAAADTVAQAASAADAASQPALAQASPPLVTDAAEPVPAAAAAHGAELPLDRLQRRLGEVLGPRGAVDTGKAGEWRVLARTSTLPAAPSPGAERRPGPVEPAPSRVAAAARSAADAAYTGPWSYSGQGGPSSWGRLKPEYIACAKGQRQSPIDIRDGLAVDLEPVRFDYRPGGVTVVDTGTTLQVNVAPGNAIELMGRRYELQQFHFHRPSEQRIEGRRYDMDVHLVHQDAEGRIAVVAVLLERGPPLPLVQTLWGHIPLEKGEAQPVLRPVDVSQLLPEDRGYYTYMGSLSTPPCTEGVLWVVMRQPLNLSAAQIDVFARLYPMNARPIQRSAGRLIKQSN